MRGCIKWMGVAFLVVVVGFTIGQLAVEIEEVSDVVVSTAVPIEKTITPVITIVPRVMSTAVFICDCTKTCDQLSVDEAYFQLNKCGCSRRDADKDGIPCEDGW